MSIAYLKIFFGFILCVSIKSMQELEGCKSLSGSLAGVQAAGIEIQCKDSSIELSFDDFTLLRKNSCVVEDMLCQSVWNPAETLEFRLAESAALKNLVEALKPRSVFDLGSCNLSELNALFQAACYLDVRTQQVKSNVFGERVYKAAVPFIEKTACVKFLTQRLNETDLASSIVKEILGSFYIESIQTRLSKELHCQNYNFFDDLMQAIPLLENVMKMPAPTFFNNLPFRVCSAELYAVFSKKLGSISTATKQKSKFKVYDLKTGCCICDESLCNFKFLQNGLFAGMEDDHHIAIFDRQKRLHSLEFNDDIDNVAHAIVNFIELDDERLLVATTNASVALFSLKTGEIEKQFRLSPLRTAEEIPSYMVPLDSNRIAFGFWSGGDHRRNLNFQIWDIQKEILLNTIIDHGPISFRDKVMSLGEDILFINRQKIIDVNTGACLLQEPSPIHGGLKLTNNHFALIFEDRIANRPHLINHYRIDVYTEKPFKRLFSLKESRDLRGIVADFETNILFTATQDRLKVWDMTSGICISQYSNLSLSEGQVIEGLTKLSGNSLALRLSNNQIKVIDLSLPGFIAKKATPSQLLLMKDLWQYKEKSFSRIRDPYWAGIFASLPSAFKNHFVNNPHWRIWWARLAQLQAFQLHPLRERKASLLKPLVGATKSQ